MFFRKGGFMGTQQNELKWLRSDKHQIIRQRDKRVFELAEVRRYPSHDTYVVVRGIVDLDDYTKEDLTTIVNHTGYQKADIIGLTTEQVRAKCVFEGLPSQELRKSTGWGSAPAADEMSLCRIERETSLEEDPLWTSGYLPSPTSKPVTSSYDKSEAAGWVNTFRFSIKSEGVYKRYRTFMKGYKALPFDKATGIHIPKPYRDLIQLFFKPVSDCKTAFDLNHKQLEDWYGNTHCLDTFKKLCEEYKDDINKMTDLLKERLSENKIEVKEDEIEEEDVVTPPSNVLEAPKPKKKKKPSKQPSESDDCFQLSLF